MNEILEPLATVIPPKYAGMLAFLLVLSQVLGRIFQALRTGGGLKSLFSAIWLGTNQPKAKEPGQADDPNQKRLFTIVGATSLAVFAFGCANPRAASYFALADIKAVVDNAEKVYGREVALGHVSEEQQLQVDEKIIQFHAAFRVAVRAARADYTASASADVQRLAESLVTLIYTFAAQPAP